MALDKINPFISTASTLKSTVQITLNLMMLTLQNERFANTKALQYH